MPRICIKDGTLEAAAPTLWRVALFAMSSFSVGALLTALLCGWALVGAFEGLPRLALPAALNWPLALRAALAYWRLAILVGVVIAVGRLGLILMQGRLAERFRIERGGGGPHSPADSTLAGRGPEARE